MAIKITDSCINCGACEPACPNTAIYEGGAAWRYSDGTGIKGTYKGHNSGVEVCVSDPQKSKSRDVYYIVTDKCTECKGFFDEPQCASVCPVDCCVKDDDNIETEEQLFAKKLSLHL